MNTSLALWLLAAAFITVSGKFPSRRKTNDQVIPRDETDGHLPRTLLPYHYNLMFRPTIILSAPPFPYIGQVDIYFDVIEATNVITINSYGLVIDEATISITVSPDSPGNPPAPVFTGLVYNTAADFLYFNLQDNLVVGEKYVLIANFTGNLRDPGQDGFYWDSYYGLDSRIKYVAATQLESIDARKMFPCFDEVDMKATFSITVQHVPYQVALSNMPIVSTLNRGDGWVADTYGKTVVMQTYLVAVVIGEFNYLTAEVDDGFEITVRVYATPPMINLMKFAAETAAARIQFWLADETGHPYQLPKMDHIALPSKGGAMENWGLITYGEEILAINPGTSSVTGRQTCGVIIAHEVAHQWYGNQVTCKWWDDIWLNEGFATNYNYFPTEAIGWEGSQQQQIDQRRGTQMYLDVDQKNNSNAVRKVIDTVWDSELSFGGSTYPKGGAMFRHIRGILTKPVLNRGLTAYLTEFAYGSATTDDLWRVLTEQAATDGVTNPDGSALDVKSRMDPWLNQMGFPLVTVSSNGDGTATATRTRFLNPRGQTQDVSSPWDYKWDVPLTVATASSAPADWDNGPVAWIDIGADSASISVPTGSWYVVNTKQNFFYRVLYDAANRAAIVNQLLDDHTLIAGESRSAIIDDTFTLSREGTVPATDAMETTRYLSNELTYNPWGSAVKHVLFIEGIIRSQAWYGTYESYFNTLLAPLLDYYGWVFDAEETILTHYLRRDVISTACSFGYAPCLDQARQLYSIYKLLPDVNSVDPNVLPTVLCTGVSEGTADDWNMVFNQYIARKSSQIREERYAYLFALTCTSDTALLDELINEIIFGANINTRDQNTVTQYLAANEYGAQKIWDFLDTYWSNVPSSINRYTTINTITSSWNTPAQLTQLEEFVDRRQPINEVQRNTFAQNSLLIQQNIDWLAANADALGAWLGSQPRTAQHATYRMPASTFQHWNIVEDSYRADINNRFY